MACADGNQALLPRGGAPLNPLNFNATQITIEPNDAMRCDGSFCELRLLLMCRNIKTLHNFEPPVTEAEVAAAALQFVRKVSGTTRQSKANEAAFERAVEAVANSVDALLGELVSVSPARDRDEEAAKAKARSVRRFGTA